MLLGGLRASYAWNGTNLLLCGGYPIFSMSMKFQIEILPFVIKANILKSLIFLKVNTMARDDFSSKVKELLGKRVGFRCSNPDCNKATSGPHTEVDKSLNIGVAAHISAAASGGPRFDVSLTPSERSAITNGIWLCQNCAKLVDNDEAMFPVELLKQWKKFAELRSLYEVSGTRSSLPQPLNAKHTPIPRIQSLPYEEARVLLLEHGWQALGRHWSQENNPDINKGNGPYFWNKGFHEIIQACPTEAASCTFAFQDVYNNILHVMTIGEVIPELEAKAHVVNWSFKNDSDDNRLENKCVPLTPPEILELAPVGAPSEKIRERLGVPDIVYEGRWKYRYSDTQVEIAFNTFGNVQSCIVALIHGETFHGKGGALGEYSLGCLTISDLIEMGHDSFIYRDSMRTKELIVPVREGPAGAWSYCVLGALVVYSGAGYLADTDFQWDSVAETLISPPDQTLFNWIGVGNEDGDAPSFDWFIKSQ